MIEKTLWLAVAGACGTLARYGLAGMVHRWLGSSFPWGTAFVNILGCLLFGLFWAAVSERGLVSPGTRTIILVGFMGAFTTFSTFVAETGRLLSDSELLMAFANVAFQMVIGVGMFFLGLAIGRTV